MSETLTVNWYWVIQIVVGTFGGVTLPLCAFWWWKIRVVRVVRPDRRRP